MHREFDFIKPTSYTQQSTETINNINSGPCKCTRFTHVDNNFHVTIQIKGVLLKTAYFIQFSRLSVGLM